MAPASKRGPKPIASPPAKKAKKLAASDDQDCDSEPELGVPDGATKSFATVDEQGVTTINVGEVGHRVAVRWEDGKWRRGTVVKLNRAGISQLYKVLSVNVLYDRNAGARHHEVPSADVVSLNESRQEVRFWTSGTPCMRTGESVDVHARKTADAAAKAAAARASMVQRPKIGARLVCFAQSVLQQSFPPPDLGPSTSASNPRTLKPSKPQTFVRFCGRPVCRERPD